MSYDVWLEIDTGAGEKVEAFWRNYTSNVAPMWRKAGVDLRELDATPAADAVQPLDAAIRTMAANPDEYRALNPPNGWGNYEGALDFLCTLHAACLAHPKTTIRVSA